MRRKFIGLSATISVLCAILIVLAEPLARADGGFTLLVGPGAHVPESKDDPTKLTTIHGPNARKVRMTKVEEFPPGLTVDQFVNSISQHKAENLWMAAPTAALTIPRREAQGNDRFWGYSPVPFESNQLSDPEKRASFTAISAEDSHLIRTLAWIDPTKPPAERVAQVVGFPSVVEAVKKYQEKHPQGGDVILNFESDNCPLAPEMASMKRVLVLCGSQRYQTAGACLRSNDKDGEPDEYLDVLVPSFASGKDTVLDAHLAGHQVRLQACKDNKDLIGQIVTPTTSFEEYIKQRCRQTWDRRASAPSATVNRSEAVALARRLTEARIKQLDEISPAPDCAKLVKQDKERHADLVRLVNSMGFMRMAESLDTSYPDSEPEVNKKQIGFLFEEAGTFLKGEEEKVWKDWESPQHAKFIASLKTIVPPRYINRKPDDPRTRLPTPEEVASFRVHRDKVKGQWTAISEMCASKKACPDLIAFVNSHWLRLNASQSKGNVHAACPLPSPKIGESVEAGLAHTESFYGCIQKTLKDWNEQKDSKGKKKLRFGDLREALDMLKQSGWERTCAALEGEKDLARRTLKCINEKMLYANAEEQSRLEDFVRLFKLTSQKTDAAPSAPRSSDPGVEPNPLAQ